MGLRMSWLGPRRSSSMDVSAAPQHDGDFSHGEAKTGKEQSGGEGLITPLAPFVSADSNSPDSYASDDDELAPPEEVLAELGSFFIIDNYLTYLSKPKDMEIILYYCNDDLGNPEWMAIAPEWQGTLGFGATSEAAAEDLQSQLVATKRDYIKAKRVMEIKDIPWNPRPEKGKAIREGRRDGYHYEDEKAYFDELADELIDGLVKWCTIQV